MAAGFFFEQSPGGGVLEIFLGVDVGGADFEAVGEVFAACFAGAGGFLFGGFLGVVSFLLRWVFGGGLGL